MSPEYVEQPGYNNTELQTSLDLRESQWSACERMVILGYNTMQSLTDMKQDIV